MKKISVLTILFVFIGFFCSCSKFNKSEDEPIGIWGDIIQFSTQEVKFNKSSGTYTITSKGNWWWIINLTVDGEYIPISRPPYEQKVEGYEMIWGAVETGPFGMSKEGIIFDEGADQELKMVAGSWFSIHKTDAKSLVIKVDKNETGKPRKVMIAVEAGNYFTGISVVQE